MSKHKRKPRAGAAASTPPRPGRRKWKIVLTAALGAAIAASAALIWHAQNSSGPPPESTHRGAPQFVGSEACASCHAAQAKAWRGSHHQLAMQEASASTVLGDFDDARYSYLGVESRFFRREGKFMVRTDGPDGKLADFEIKYTFGVTPLQQYLIEFPGGRLQALSLVWDARPKSAGGQRWFHLYPDERIDHKDQLHWTGLYQNWNLQCAACHSTNLKKGYDAASNSYRTSFSEISVGCEACHGPGSRHVDWAKHKGGDKGLAAASMNACAACHARRSTISEEGRPGAPLEETHRLAMLTQPTYYADGQQRDEDYTWGSFLQSRMFQRGVTCMDCHEPHALRLRAEGNAVCARCHDAAAFDTEKHHFHEPGTQGAQCVECHMPARKYMVVDARRDHSIRIPRPDLSPSLESPNACTQCHAARKPEWAAAAMDWWYGKAWRDRWHYGTTLHAGATQGAKALRALLALAEDPGTPPIVGATAATLAQPHVRPDTLPAARRLLANADPAVRIAALGLIEPFEPAARARAAAALLADPVRGVRVEAARVLADLDDAQLSPGERRARDKATAEYVAALELDADWPAANVTLGNFRLRQGRPQEAIAAYERAIALDPRFAGAYVNLADVYRQHGRDADGEALLRRGLALLPRAADLHHALGLLLVRKGDKGAALRELAVAAKLAPDNARYGYVYAVGLHSAGRRGEALSVLRATEARHPYDPEILGALVSVLREAGKPQDALPYARRLAEILQRQ